jgi:purine catabolism regulator
VRLFELIRDTPFGLELATRNTSTNRRVVGGHVVEMPDPGRWLAPDYIALTTGIALKGSTARQREFVESVQSCGSAALGFGVGVNFAQIPRAIVKTAEQVGLPVVIVPLEVPFREVLDFISRSTLITGFQDFSRALRLQDYLLASLEDSDAEASLAKRLSELTLGSVAIFRPEGRLVARAGRPPVDDMWTAIRQSSAVARSDRRRLVSIEVKLGGDPRYYLALSVRDDDRSEAYGCEVLKFGARVAQAIAAAGKIAMAQERAARSGLLSSLLTAEDVAPDVADRLGMFSLELGVTTNVLAARSSLNGRPHQPESQPGGELASVAQACEVVFHEFHVPYLSSTSAGCAVAVWQDGRHNGSLVAALTAMAKVRSLSMGFSRPASDVSSLKQALAEARVALLDAERYDEPTVVDYDDLALSDLILTQSPPELAERAGSILDPLRGGRPEMFETLVAYLAHDCDVIACAKEMYVHPNTLRYRLSRIEAILGRSLRSVSTLADLYLALRLQVPPD